MSIDPIFLFDPFDLWDLDDTSYGARVDWKETAEAHVIKADLPGVRKEEVKVEVQDGNVLQISGQRKREENEEGDDVNKLKEKEAEGSSWHRLERRFGSFLRRFRLPRDAKTDEAKASMENGVLTVTVPKQDKQQPTSKAIDISSA
ncbi:16.9 kDa class I heat shock protein 2-like [Ananas comosus]|uniref:16.9 kDa class I heat shock protein 2-like n=2 Tax=Ananas comosus TaxID=4615 RepID=A0A6P5H184_ANACO|nr:16.9 kDa class I heat shock protein 2-like [Ananas comosus]